MPSTQVAYSSSGQSSVRPSNVERHEMSCWIALGISGRAEHRGDEPDALPRDHRRPACAPGDELAPDAAADDPDQQRERDAAGDVEPLAQTDLVAGCLDRPLWQAAACPQVRGASRGGRGDATGRGRSSSLPRGGRGPHALRQVGTGRRGPRHGPGADAAVGRLGRMADRSSRSKKKSRGRARGAEVRKQPELRTGGGRQAKADALARAGSGRVAQRRGRTAGAHPSAGRARASCSMLLVGYAGVALVVLAGFHLDRWNEAGTPASLWLYVAIGFTAVAPAVGRRGAQLARRRPPGTRRRCSSHSALLVGEAMLGQGCPDGGSCASIGARGSLGLIGSIVVVARCSRCSGGAALALALRARARSPPRERARALRVRSRSRWRPPCCSSGVPVAAAVVGTDLLVRDAPGRAQDARDYVAKQCLELGSGHGSRGSSRAGGDLRRLDHLRRAPRRRGPPRARPGGEAAHGLERTRHGPPVRGDRRPTTSVARWRCSRATRSTRRAAPPRPTT